MWRQHQDLNQGHIGGRQLLLPMPHPCSSSSLCKYSWTSTNSHFYTMATSLQWSPFFWWTVHTLTLVQTSLERPLSFFPKVAVNWICYPWKCYSHKNAWGHKKRFTLSCSPRAMTWSIRKDKSPQSLKNDAISLWKLGTLSSGQTLTTAKYHNKNYIRWLLGIKKNPYDKKRTKVLQIKKMIDNS